MLAQFPFGGLRVFCPEKDIEPVEIAVIDIDSRFNTGVLQVADAGQAHQGTACSAGLE